MFTVEQLKEMAHWVMTDFKNQFVLDEVTIDAETGDATFTLLQDGHGGTFTVLCAKEWSRGEIEGALTNALQRRV